MSDQKKKIILSMLIIFSSIIIILVGSTFAYFSATVGSEDKINVSSAEFALSLEDDTDLIKKSLIPSIEEYVDIASSRLNQTGDDFFKPYEDEKGNLIKEKTACIDDNQNEICSIYTFTIISEMTKVDTPLYITLTPTSNTFENLYIKILDENKKEVPGSKMQVIDYRYETEVVDGVIKYKKDEDGYWIRKENFDELPVQPLVLESINKILPRATEDEETKEIIPSKQTYSIVMWIMELGREQNIEDSNKIFTSTLRVSASGPDGGGITGTISAIGKENEE